jgi:SSS family solute:Na+ symporter
MGSTFLAAYTFTLYWKKTSKAGAWAGILGGFSFTMFWYIFVYYKTAPAIIGSSIIESYKINMLDPLFIALPLSFILVFVVSILVKQSPEEEKIVEKAFENIH